MPDVLVVDDDRAARESLGRALVKEGFEVRTAADGLSALDEISAEPPATVVLDVSLPGMTTIEVVRDIRAQRRTLPVCVLAGRDDAADRLAALAAGADDCLVKPFAATELAARLQAMGRLGTDDQRPLHLGDLTIEPARRVATRRGRDLDLTTRELEVLAVLARHASRAVTRPQLLAQVWGYTWEVDGDVVDVFVGGLRRKLEAAGEPRVLSRVSGDRFVVTA
ncbi:response regulator transcription factor [Actinoplanes sp. NPDC051343]|uniref:response regulator transcription factor n=1 Tax=Actinoplanes sp. NPDC051343 TaxID=3363906 RepID=UPI00379279C0